MTYPFHFLFPASTKTCFLLNVIYLNENSHEPGDHLFLLFIQI